MIDAEPTTSDLTPHRLGLIARLLAEEHLLVAWSDDAPHPRLAAAYRSLHGRISARCAAVRAAVQTPEERRAVLDATLAAHEEGLGVRFELSRLKQLLAQRRERLQHDGLPGYAAFAAAETEEAELLEGLIAQLARGVC